MPDDSSDLEIKCAASNIASDTVDAYVIPASTDDTKEEQNRGYVYASDAFNRAASAEQRATVKQAKELTVRSLGRAFHGKTEQERLSNETTAYDAMIKSAEVVASVLIATHNQAESDFTRYFRYAADTEKCDIATLADIYDAEGATVLARIARAALNEPPCPREPTTHRITRFGVTIK